MQVILLFCILQDCCLDWRKVLLVTQIDMVQKWTLPGQERACHLKRLRMPKFGLLLLGWSVETLILFHLNYEADFCRVAEVGDGESTDLLDERLTCELKLVLTLLDEVLDFVWLELHDRTNTEFVCPLALVQVSENVLHVGYLFASSCPV